MTHDKKRLLSIGEAAKALEVTRRMILNYEDKGLIMPIITARRIWSR